MTTEDVRMEREEARSHESLLEWLSEEVFTLVDLFDLSLYHSGGVRWAWQHNIQKYFMNTAV